MWGWSPFVTQAQFQAAIGGLQTEIEELKTMADAIQTACAAITASLNDIATDLTNLATTFQNSGADTAAVQQLQTLASTVQQQADALNQAVNPPSGGGS
jgi:methyl-accepting chemotaxis protein